MDQLENFVRSFEKVSDLEELNSVFKDICTQFQYVSCALISTSETVEEIKSDQTIGVISSQLTHWLTTQSQHLIRSLNTGSCPVYLKDVKSAIKSPNGFAIALGGSNYQRSIVLVEFGDEYTYELIEKVSWYWLIISHYALGALSRCTAKMSVNFTPREIECLRWVSKGKTSWEVSRILGVSERTVNFHIQNCMKKTNSVNRQQAVTKGLMGGII
ncbi:helix-turn-helix transcriptional regulator [Sessilibacter sp. MAH2]